MTLSEMKDLLTYVWYLFLICLIIYLIVGIAYALIKQVKRDIKTEQEVKKLMEDFIKDRKK